MLLVVLAGCPRGTRRTLVPDVPQTGDAQARSRFAEARSKFLNDDGKAEDFRRIAEEFPDDPIVPWAQLYAGIAAVKERNFEVAERDLGEVIASGRNAGLTQRAELFLGITRNYRGDSRGALELLRRSERAIEGDAERTEWLAAIAFASAASDRPMSSLAAFDQLWKRVSPAERAVIVARIDEVVAAADPDLVRRAFDDLDDRRGPSIAVVASRLAAIAEQRNQPDEARRMREVAGPLRTAVGLPRAIGTAAGAAGGSSGLIGAVMPFGGKSNLIATNATAGLGLAAGATTGQGVAAIELRSADDPAATDLAIENLARAGVVAVIVGSTEGAAVDAAATRAESLGLPMFSLHAQPEKRVTGKYVFHMQHSPVARARSLAKRALAAGVKKFAVLSADTPYGRGVAAAFVEEVQAGGGRIIDRESYPADTKSFPATVKKLGSGWDAVFVAENSEVLGLIAPALAAGGHVPRPLGTKKVTGGRPVLLLSTAEGLRAKYVSDAGRHSEGAWFAPGYYPDDQEPASRAFVDQFVASFGRAPGAIEAYAYDAAQLAASAGAGGRGALIGALGSGSLAGLTGTIRFDARHNRADPSVIYTVVEDNGAYAIRIAK